MRLRTKVLAIALPLSAAFAGVAALESRRRTEALMVRELARRVEPPVLDFAAGLAPELAAGRRKRLLRRLEEAKRFWGAACADVLDSAGAVMARTDPPGEKWRVEERAPAAPDAPAWARASGADGPVLLVRAPIWERPPSAPPRRAGTFRLAIPLRATLESSRLVGAEVATLAGAFCLLALCLTLFLLRLLLRPLREIAAATERVAAGEYGAQVPVPSRDELGELAGAFNRMGETLSRTAVSRGLLEEALAVESATLDASADGILVVGAGRRVLRYNRRFLEMWGIPEDLARRAASSAELVDFVLPQIADSESFLEGVTRGEFDFPAAEKRDDVALKDGRVFERISRPFLLAGRVAGRTLTFRDLSLHFEGLRALSQARDEAVEAARLRSRFLANVSHELRTPLNAVIGAADLLGRTRLDQEQRELSDTLSRASRALLEMVNGVLDFSKIEAGRMTVERTALRPDALLADAAALVAPRAAEKGLAFRVDAGGAGDLEVMGDPTRLRQVLLNLMANAVKFTERGEVLSEIRVLARGDSSAELEFSVRDSGIGIASDQARLLFAPFAQGDGSTTRRYGGTGLGLAISKSLVELMGGEIGFESEPGRGSRFWFRLRMDRAAPAEPAPAARGVEGPRDRLRVLVVEDNGVNRQLMTRMLDRLGCPWSADTDGREALSRLEREEFGLVLLDCQMPGLDGYSTAAEIRRREAGRSRVPIVAITANASEEDRRRCRDAGMDGFIPKPATLDSVAAELDRWDLPFDETALAAFASLAAGPGELPALLSRFLDDAAARLEEVRRAEEAGDGAARRRAAHTVKGSAAAVGARGLRELARRLELDGPAAGLLLQAAAELARLRADAARRG